MPDHVTVLRPTTQVPNKESEKLPRFDRHEIRQFIDAPLSIGAEIALDKSTSHYLINVMRVDHEKAVTVFNGVDGSFLGRLSISGKKANLTIEAQVSEQPNISPLYLLCAPIKSARTEYLVQKAVEMGVSHVWPIQTQHGQISKISLEKWQRYAIEAAEQCGILTIPEIQDIDKIDRVIEVLPDDVVVIFCDETANAETSFSDLASMKGKTPALVIGPEGGFSEIERRYLHNRGGVHILSLGPRILRADTAVVAALALIQAQMGDWYE